MKKIILGVSTTALLSTLSSVAIGGSMEFTPPASTNFVETSQVGGEFSLWGLGVVPTNYLEESDTCDDGTDFCGSVIGFGASASVYVPLNNNLSMGADLLFETHPETDSDTSLRDDSGVYGSLGLRLTNEANANMPWGGFAFLISGANNENGNRAGPLVGVGGEIMVNGFAIQAGGMVVIDPYDTVDDTLQNLMFVGVSRDFNVGNGILSAGAMYGAGDFDEDTGAVSDYDPGYWAQVSVMYTAPLGNTNLNWFAGYQGDFVSVDNYLGNSVEQVLMNSFKVGINIPIGGGTGPFTTPNFRAPVVNAGALN